MICAWKYQYTYIWARVVLGIALPAMARDTRISLTAKTRIFIFLKSGIDLHWSAVGPTLHDIYKLLFWVLIFFVSISCIYVDEIPWDTGIIPSTRVETQVCCFSLISWTSQLGWEVMSTSSLFSTYQSVSSDLISGATLQSSYQRYPSKYPQFFHLWLQKCLFKVRDRLFNKSINNP